MIAVVYELRLTPAQQEALVSLVRADRNERPQAVIARIVCVDGDMVQITAIWQSRDALENHLSAAPAPVAGMLAAVGAHAPARIIEVAEYG